MLTRLPDLFTLSIKHMIHIRFFFFNDTATTEIYTLSLHDALPIFRAAHGRGHGRRVEVAYAADVLVFAAARNQPRSEEHTSELQSHSDLVCRLLLEKKKSHTAKSASSDASFLHDRSDRTASSALTL